MQKLFGGLIALILLGLYVYAVLFAILIVNCLSTEGCSRFTSANFTTGFAATLSTVAGLVSALVIAVLAITKPGDTPGVKLLNVNATPKAKTTLTVVAGFYLFAWVCTGLAAYVVGAMWHPGILQPLTDLGQAWLGLAVAAAYAYFGLSP
jgi:hypothetical protein